MELFTLFGVNGQLYVYEDHIEIYRKGLVSRVTHRNCNYTEIRFDEMEQVKMHLGTPLYSGYFYFKRLNSNKKCNLIDAARDEDCLVFRFYRNRDALKIRKYLKKKV